MYMWKTFQSYDGLLYYSQTYIYAIKSVYIHVIGSLFKFKFHVRNFVA
jgi:hypothetical protein